MPFKYHDPKKYERNFWASLVYETDGSLNLSWVLCIIIGICGCIGFIHAVFTAATIFEKVAAWSFLGGSFSLVILAAIPIAKAKILATSTVPGEMSKNISSITANLHDPGISTDVQESYKKVTTTEDRG